MKISTLACACLVISGCGKVVDVPRAVATTVTVTGDNQSAPVGTALPSSPAITVRDQGGNAMAGVPIVVTVTLGGGKVDNAPTTTATSGSTSLGTWTLGKAPGPNILGVTVDGRISRPIVATGLAGSPSKVVVASGGSGISGVVGIPVATNVTFQVVDQANNPVQGASVTVSATDGGFGTLNAPTTDGSGNVQLTRWTLGTTAGTQTLTVGVDGATAATITATVRAAAVATLTPVQTLPIRGYAGAPGATPVSVRATDIWGNPVSGVTVTFAVRDGGGSITGPVTATSSTTGVATAGSWTLGPTFNTQNLVASTGAVATLFTGQIISDFKASVRYNGVVSDFVQAAAKTAIDRLRTGVVGHLDDSALDNTDVATLCGVTGAVPLSETIHDMLFFVQVVAIDGPGGAIAQQVPCVRRVNLTGVVSVINIDAADVDAAIADGTLASYILHEMIHGLGFGGAWINTLITGFGTGDPRFLGTAATAAFANAGGTDASGIPIENVGPVGTINVHWRAASFGNELMVAPIGSMANRRLSAITLASLADLGYGVNLYAADPFSFSTALRALPPPGAATPTPK